MAIQYKIASGEPTRKWKYSVGGGLPSGAALTMLLAYAIGRLDPQMPPEVLAAAAALGASVLTGATMAAIGWLTRPSAADKPVIDEAASKRPVEPLPPG